MRLLLPALCEALSAKGVRIRLERRNNEPCCIATPPSALTPALIEGLKRFRPEILRALRRVDQGASVELHHCPRCGSDVVLNTTDLCGTCAQLTHVVIAMEPDSPAEVAYLKTLVEECSRTVATVPNCPKEVTSTANTTSGTVGIVGTVHTGNRRMRTRMEEKVKST